MLDDRSEAKVAVSHVVLLQCKSCSNGALMHGARHAVLETLYSRAHRIGLEGASCLLDGLRKNVSFSFFAVVVISVLGRPSLEVFILAEQQLQGFGNDVGGRSIDELRIALQLSLNRFFDAGLDGDGLWLFWW